MANKDLKIQRWISWIGLILVFLATGCTTLPDYARPRRTPVPLDPSQLGEAVTYRRLTRSDFKATALPKDRARHADTLNAHTCVRIRPTKDSKITVHRGDHNGSSAFFGRIEHVAFEAVLFPGCSWWNPDMPSHLHAYVLQHEQIHFAIAELTARRLTTDVRNRAQTLLVIKPSVGEVREKITSMVNQWIQSALDESISVHTDFDEDTSIYPNPKWQLVWQEKIEKQLTELPPPSPD